MRANTMIEQILRPLGQLSLVIAATFVASSALLGLAWSIAYVPATVAAFFAWRSLRPRSRPASDGHDERRAVSREFWRFSLPRALTSVLQMLIQRFDIVLVGAISRGRRRRHLRGSDALHRRRSARDECADVRRPAATRCPVVDGDRQGDQRALPDLDGLADPGDLADVLHDDSFRRAAAARLRSRLHHRPTAILLIAFSMLISTGLGMVDTILAMAGHTSWNLGNAALALPPISVSTCG